MDVSVGQHNELILAFLFAQLIILHQVSGIIQPRGCSWEMRLRTWCCVLKVSGFLLLLQEELLVWKNINSGYFGVGKSMGFAGPELCSGT